MRKLPQEPIFLPDLEAKPVSGERGEMLRSMKASGQHVPQIYYLFNFKPERSRHLANFTEGVMRGPSPLEPGTRELIAAYTSRLNRCLY
jgi:alkylhydroperoxidase family enzyme